MKARLKLHDNVCALILTSILMPLTKKLTMMEMEIFHTMNWLNSSGKITASL